MIWRLLMLTPTWTKELKNSMVTECKDFVLTRSRVSLKTSQLTRVTMTRLARPFSVAIYLVKARLIQPTAQILKWTKISNAMSRQMTTSCLNKTLAHWPWFAMSLVVMKKIRATSLHRANPRLVNMVSMQMSVLITLSKDPLIWIQWISFHTPMKKQLPVFNILHQEW